jgi:hypothetical protein
MDKIIYLLRGWLPIKVCEAWALPDWVAGAALMGSSVRLGMLHLRRGAPGFGDVKLGVLLRSGATIISRTACDVHA